MNSLKNLDRKVKLSRIWSNKELKNISPLFDGNVINVSGWKDLDKQGSNYKDYFYNASEYWLSNYEEDSKGYQGDIKNEILLDLESKLPSQYINKFDVVYNHTVLEHVYDFKLAFKNICSMSKDIVITVVPFIQHQHAQNADFEDYWRFTPVSLKKLYEENNLKLIYINFNDNWNQSVYIFAIGSRHPDRWDRIKNIKYNKISTIESKVGYKVVTQNPIYSLYRKYRNIKIYIYDKIFRTYK